MRRSTLWVAISTMAVALAGSPGGARGQVPGSELWDAGRNWLSVRAGYAKAAGELNGNGGIGYGFGFAHMLHPVKVGRWSLLRQFSLGGYVHYEALDHFSSSVEVEIPATIELVRHFKWSTPFRPYLGVGAGQFYRKLYRTTADTRRIDWGGYLSFGANSPIGGRQLLGFDGRLIRVDSSNIPADPVFGPGTAEEDEPGVIVRKNGTHWSAKVNYTIAY